jgi:hypothetical protein
MMDPTRSSEPHAGSNGAPRLVVSGIEHRFVYTTSETEAICDFLQTAIRLEGLDCNRSHSGLAVMFASSHT